MKKIDPGPVGMIVARNVRRLRGDTSYAELSRRLDELGRPIPPLGLRHLEAGARRIDVDDLVMLALALDVPPMTLVLPAGRPQQAAHLFIAGPKGMAVDPFGPPTSVREAFTDGDD
ncbi:MAG: helix-turn-helix domain-containing protein [Mycobacterium sp.]